MAAKSGAGKGVSQEISIIAKLKEMVRTDSKVYYILWRYAPQLLLNGEELKTFDDLKNHYKSFSEGLTEPMCENWLVEENVQIAVKWLLKRLHQQKMIELYNLYFEKAKDDTNAFKAFTDFSDKFFATEKESEILSILKNVDIPEDDT